MPQNQLTVSRVAGRVGAEISGIDLAEAPDGPTVAAIRETLLDHKDRPAGVDGRESEPIAAGPFPAQSAVVA